MLYILAIAVLILVGSYFIAPVRHVVRASRPYATVKERASDRWLMFRLISDDNGRPVPTVGRFVGRVTGTSMVNRGLADGSTIVADYLSPHEREILKRGDVVVVLDKHKQAEANNSAEYCLRAIRSIKGGVVDYEDDSTGKHEPHPIDQMVAIVTRVAAIPSRKTFHFFGRTKETA